MAKAVADMTADEVAALEAKLDAAAKTPADPAIPSALSQFPPGPNGPFPKGRAPAQVNGGFAPDSKRFSITNWMVNGLAGQNPEKAKFESHTMDRLRKSINETGSRYMGASANAYWLPISFDLLPNEVLETDDGLYAKSALSSIGDAQYDPMEHAWLVQKGLVRKASQSAYTDSLGGSLVAPPTMGEVIPIIRPNAAFLAAGAKTQSLPPSGRFVRPRITSSTTAQGLGEGQMTPNSTVGTNQMVLQAKKIAGAVYINEEATNFTSGTLDRIAQADLGVTLGLKIDAYAFYGTGTTEIPAGLTSSAYTSTSAGASALVNVTVDYSTASGIQANGNEILPEYGDRFPTLIKERSFGIADGSEMGAWVMRPAALSRARSKRADAVTARDGQGVFVDVLKRFNEAPAGNQFAGHRVVETTNLKNNLTKGSATDLSDVFFGLWNYAILGTYGAVQFTQGHDGNTFLNGQYILRGVMWGDIGFEYPQAFLWYTSVLGASGLIS